MTANAPIAITIPPRPTIPPEVLTSITRTTEALRANLALLDTRAFREMAEMVAANGAALKEAFANIESVMPKMRERYELLAGTEHARGLDLAEDLRLAASEAAADGSWLDDLPSERKELAVALATLLAESLGLLALLERLRDLEIACRLFLVVLTLRAVLLELVLATQRRRRLP
jgi:hypothetical protein